MEVSVLLTKGLSIKIEIWLNGYPTNAIVDSGAMVTLVKEELFTSTCGHLRYGPTCVLSGIGEDKVHGHFVDNVPITIGTITYTVCVAPISDDFILGLDFLKSTGSVINLANNTVMLGNEVIPASIDVDTGLQVSRVLVKHRTVVPSNTVGFIKVKLESPIEGKFLLEADPYKNALISSVYGEGKEITVKVINDTSNYITFKRNSIIGSAESALRLESPGNTECMSVRKVSGA